jgi:hypothetical protein
MLLIFIIIAAIAIPVRSANFTAVGEAISIMALTLSVPHSVIMRDHSRMLDFLQTTYLIISYPNQNY